jgi:succinylglutamate desuccinylase
METALRALAGGDFAQVADSFAQAGLKVSQPARGVLRLACSAGPPRKRLLLSAGIHGDETAPIEMLAHLLRDLVAKPGSLAVDLMVVVGNPEAVVQGRRFIDADLNRMFRAERGELQSAAEAERADLIMRSVADFMSVPQAETWHLDLHTAIRASYYQTFAVVPHLVADSRKRELLAWLGEAGIDAAILSPSSAGTFSAWTASSFGAIAATLELGQVSPLGTNEPGRFADTRAALECLLGTAVAPAEARLPQVFKVAQELIKKSEAFRMAFGPETKNFTPMQPGEVIAQDGELVYRVGAETEYVVFPNPDVRVGLRAGLMVVRSSTWSLL